MTGTGLTTSIGSPLETSDAVSVLEHGLSGLGIALAGAAILPLYYFAMQLLQTGEVDTPG